MQIYKEIGGLFFTLISSSLITRALQLDFAAKFCFNKILHVLFAYIQDT